MHRNEDSASAKNPKKKSLKRKYDEVVAIDAIDAIEEIGLAAIDAIEDIEVAEEGMHPRKKRRTDADTAAADAFEARAALDALIAPPQPIIERRFTSADTDKMSENEFFRYEVPYRGSDSPPKKVAHAVIVGDTALQFAIPAGEKDETPLIRPLEDIEEFTSFGASRLRAHTPDGTKMFASRFVDGEFDGEALRIANFSPPPKNKEFPFWGSEKEVPLLRKDMKEKEKKELQKELAEIFAANKTANKERLGREETSLIKGGTELVIDPPSVQIRDGIKTRIPDQNTVMGESAKEAYQGFLGKYEDVLSEEMKMVLTRAKDAHLTHQPRDTPQQSGQYRPEWGHLEGFSLTPTTKDPQTKDNLGAMPKWANTMMMVAERTIKWVALNRPEALSKIKAEFKMLLDSELVDKIDYVATIEENGHTFAIHQKINPIKQWPVFPQPTDTMQTIAITHSLLTDAPAASKSEIKRLNKSKKPATPGGLADRPIGVVEDAMELEEVEVIEKPVAVKPVAEKGDEAMRPRVRKPVAEKPVVTAKPQAKAPVAVRPEAAPAVQAAALFDAASFPTTVSYEKSVLQISSTFQTFDYNEPWSGAEIHYCHGSGSVVEHEGRKYILTNAHVVENAVDLDVRFANDRTRIYEATVYKKITGYQCDLALLDIDDPEFQEKAVPVLLGDMTPIKQAVETVGFPMGGSEISISDGIVSRIEVRDYCMSKLDMLQVQVDAAVNPGNSGGPVFSGGKQVGVAFQGYDRQGLGFMIPMPIVKHFLEEVWSDQPYRGFPILPVEMQTLENAALRQYYGLVGKQTGVRIKNIDFLSDAYKKLKVDDVLVEIDGLPVSNRGTVDIPGIGNVIDLVHITHQKFIGDSVHLKVFRRHEDTKKIETVELEVELDCVPWDSTKVPTTEYDKMPTYYINSGVVFMPLTRNYLEDRGVELEEFISMETGERISEVAKKTPGEEYVVINTILSHKDTKGYDDVSSYLVKEANGIKINNLKDLISALESNKEPFHTILTGTKNRVVVPNMSASEHAKLLHRYHIKDDRSDDLKMPAPVDAMVIDEPSGPPPPAPKIVRPKPISATTAAMLKMMAPPKPVEPSDEEELMPDWEGSEESVPVAKEKRQLTLDDLPGVKRYRSALDHIEAKVKLVDGLDFEDEGIAIEDLGEGDSNESSEKEESIVEIQPQRHTRASRHHASTFTRKPASKRGRDEDDEEDLHDKKRAKR